MRVEFIIQALMEMISGQMPNSKFDSTETGAGTPYVKPVMVELVVGIGAHQ